MDANTKPEKNLRAATRWNWLIAAVPILAAAWAHVVGPIAQPIQGAIDRPGLAFEQYLVNRGPVSPRKYVMAKYRFTNTSDQTIKLGEMRPSCGCMTPKLDKEVFAPGEQGEFTLTVDTTGAAAGEKEYFLDIPYRDSRPRSTRVTFKVILPERQVVVRPRALIVYQYNTTPTERTITVSDYREDKLNVLQARSSSSWAHVELLGAETDSDGNPHTLVSVVVSGDVPPGQHQANITLTTDDPGYAELQIPMVIQGPPEQVQHASQETPAESP